MSDPDFTFEDITPEKAAEYLARNNANRPITENNVAAWERQMKAGKWVVNGENIGFNVAGDLVDGQHRLLAVTRAGVTVRMGVMRGLPMDAFETINSGRKRTGADVLGILGIANRHVVAAIARLVIAYKAQTTSGSVKALTNNEISSFVQQHEDAFVQAAAATGAMRKAIPANASVIGAAWYIFNEIDPGKCYEFFDGIVQARTDGEGDPRLALIRRLSSMRLDNQTVRQDLIFDLFIKTWNAWVTNRSVARMMLERKAQWRQAMRPRKVGEQISAEYERYDEDGTVVDVTQTPKPFEGVPADAT